MRNKKFGLILVVVAVVAIAGVWITRIEQKNSSGEIMKEATPFIGSIRTFISCTGTVLPKNRLAVKPPVNGRVESVLVQEGEKVKTGQILAWMSSTDRAALLDAARGQGEQALKHWEDTYKPIALLAPIDGEVIVSTTQPGQTVTTTDAVVVLSDHLIVRAQVDETDIGKIKLGQKAVLTLDAYPDTKIHASVDHIYYESQTVSNVTIYLVDLLPEEVPPFFRSGMNAAVDFIDQDKEDILVIPVDAVSKEKNGDYVFVKEDEKAEPVKTAVKLGISDDKNIEVISGVNKGDRIVSKSKKYVLPKSSVSGSNPFLPARRR
jgi:membrane fusion protein, macrolide-specific efflux system